MNAIFKVTVVSLSTIGALGAPVAAQNNGNMWNPNAPQQGRVAQPPKFIGEAPAATPSAAQPPRQPSRFAPAGLEQQLDARQYSSSNQTVVQPQPQVQPQQMPVQQFAAPPQQPLPGYGAGPQNFGFSGPQQPFAGLPPGYGPYPQQGFNGFQQGYGGFSPGYGGAPQGYGGYPQAYGPPSGYSNPGYPGGGFFGQPSPFGFPGNFGSFPGTSSYGGVPGFGFSPFGFF